MRKKHNIIVGLTTFNNEMLQISVPALGKLHQKFMLIIHNNNPTTTVSRRQIRRLGYCGDLQIINANENIGELRARIEIVKTARETNPTWIVFCNDDDLLIDLEIPHVANDNFAVIQNAVVLKHRISDLLRVMSNPLDFDIDGENVTLLRPNVGIAGTPIRATVLFGLVKVLQQIINDISKLDEKLNFYPPIGAMMWNFINIYARHINPNSAPIYMDKINYIKNDLNTAGTKYNILARPVRNPEEYYKRALEKYDALLQAALNTNAAPRG